MGPDKIHPKLLHSLAEIEDFVTALTLLYKKCFESSLILGQQKIWTGNSFLRIAQLFKITFSLDLTV